jgi:CheY-like chemotaxis protein
VTRILIVDDDDDVREVCVDVLTDEGHEVTMARNGNEALELLRRGLRPGVILLDLMMPVMNGFEFRARQLADPSLADLPVVLLTAGSVSERVYALRPLACLTKPFELEELLRVLACVPPSPPSPRGSRSP